MIGAGARETGIGLWILMGFLGFAATLGATPLGNAVALYRQRHFAEARALLEHLVAAEPANAEAAYYLGMAAYRAGGPGALDAGRLWLGKAVKLAPGKPGYLAEYAGVCLLLADRDSSLALALEGRDAMTQAIAGDPDDLDAREGLMRYYAKAPWPLGDATKALDQAAEIARRSPPRGLAAYRSLVGTFERAGRKEAALSADQAAQSLARRPPQ
jgi:cytochrome c-type biogenesis protein CcmH/NrfG